MCLGAPGKVVSVNGDMAEVDFNGISRGVSLLICPGIKEGDYVLVHVGFAIQKLEKEDALETLRLFREMDDINRESSDENG